MDSKLVSYLKPSKAIIFELDNSTCCVVSVSRTGHPITREYLKLAYAKMDAVSDYERQQSLMYISDGKPDFFVRLRCIDIDNKLVFSATMHVDIIVRQDMTKEDINALKEEIRCGLAPVLSIDSADKFGAKCHLVISVKPALLATDSLIPAWMLSTKSIFRFFYHSPSG